MNSVGLGQHYVASLLQNSNSQDNVGEVLRANYSPTELVQLELRPDHGALVVHGKDKVVEIKLQVRQFPQYVGQFKSKDLIAQSKHWVTHAYQTILRFKDVEDVYLVYFPDYKILKIATLDDVRVEFIKDVVWSIE